MILYLYENSQGPIEAVAVRGVGGMGQGNNAIGYEAKTTEGRWFIILKKHNPHLKVKVKKSDLRWVRVRGGHVGYSDEIAL